MAKYTQDGKVQVEAGDTLYGIYGPNWRQASGYQGDPRQLPIGTVLPTAGANWGTPAPQPRSTPSNTNTAYASYQPGSAVSSPGFVNGTPDWVKPIVQKASAKYNIPTMMLSALLKQESGFNPNAQSYVGASGIAQFMPATAQSFGIDPLDPEQAIPAAAKYLRTEWDRFGKPELALAAYNAGGGAVEQYGGIPPYKETQNYVKNIMAMAGEPHATANQRVIDIERDAKKQEQSVKQETAPRAREEQPRKIDTPITTSGYASNTPRLQQQLREAPIYDDLGRMKDNVFGGQGPEGDWLSRTTQSWLKRSNDIMGQTPPLSVKVPTPSAIKKFSVFDPEERPYMNVRGKII